MKHLTCSLGSVSLAALLCLASVSASAQSASGVATGGGSVSPGSSSATVGSGGSAASGGTSASTVGTAGTSTGTGGSSSSMGVGGTAAGEKAATRSKVNPNANNGQASATANEGGGVWSKSRTHTKVRKDGTVDTRTRSMAHEPGGPPVKSTVKSSATPQ